MQSGHRIVGIDIGDRTKDLLRGLQWIAPSAFISRMLTGVATVLAARWMGPSGFGEASLALAITFWIQVPLFMGIPIAIMHYLPGKSYEDRRDWEQAGLSLLSMTILVTLVAAYVLRSFWAHLNGVGIFTFKLSLIWCAGYALYFPGTSLLNARESYKSRAAAEIIFAVIFAFSIFTLHATHHMSPLTYIAVLAMGYGLTGAVILGRTPFEIFRRTPNLGHTVKTLFTYSLIASLGTLSGALFNAPARLIANRHLSLQEVGILSAYQGGSIQMASFFIGVGSQVFFPIASRTPNKKTLLNKLTRLILLGSPAAWILFAGLLAFYFLVLGKHYPLDLKTLIIFACAAYFALWYGLLGWFLASVGRRGMLISIINGVIAGLLNFGCCLFFIPRWHIKGAGLAYVAASAIGVFSCYLPAVQRQFRLPSDPGDGTIDLPQQVP